MVMEKPQQVAGLAELSGSGDGNKLFVGTYACTYHLLRGRASDQKLHDLIRTSTWL